MTIDSFLEFFNGIYADYDGAYGDQCFDLANAYSRWIGGQRFNGATADLIFSQPGDFYIQIPNTLDYVPQKGDLIMWNWPHVGIATGNNSDTNQFEVLEQNDPLNSNCHIKIYPNYNGVIGALRAKVNSEVITQPTTQPFVNVYTPQTKIPVTIDGQTVDTELQALNSKLAEITTKDQQINSLKSEIDVLDQHVTKLSNDFADDEKEIMDLKQKLDDSQTKINELNTQLFKMSAQQPKYTNTSAPINLPKTPEDATIIFAPFLISLWNSIKSKVYKTP